MNSVFRLLIFGAYIYGIFTRDIQTILVCGFAIVNLQLGDLK